MEGLETTQLGLVSADFVASENGQPFQRGMTYNCLNAAKSNNLKAGPLFTLRLSFVPLQRTAAQSFLAWKRE